MMGFAKKLAATLLFVTAIAAPLSIAEAGEDLGNVEGWSIGFFTTDTSNRCQATAEYNRGTVLKLILMEDNDGKHWAIILYDPKWVNWVKRKTNHTLYFKTINGLADGKFRSGDEDILLATDIRLKYMETLADTGDLQIFDDDKRLLASLSMKGSRAAIMAVIECKNQRPYVPQSNKQEEAQTKSGTGFFVATNYVLTDNHVIENCSNISIRYPDKPWYPATTAGLDKVNDLALLKTDLDGDLSASFRLRPRLGEQVAAYGFPYSDFLSASGNFSLGNVTSQSGLGDDTRFLQMSAPIQPGNSGGPLLDLSGNVVGVVVAQLNALEVMKAANSIPQNVNFAIQMPIVFNFLTVKGIEVTPNVEANIAHPLNPADVAEMARKFTVQIYCSAAPPTYVRAGRTPRG